MGEFLKKHRKTFIIVIAVLLVLILSLIAFLVVRMNTYQAGKYNRTAFSVKGGSAQEEANLSQISAALQEDGAVCIRFGFTRGSAIEDAPVPCGVPAYCVSFLPSPLRMCVSFDDLSYWDYVIGGTPSDPLGLIGGMFQMTKGESSTVLYFNLSDGVTFQVKEEADALNVMLLPQNEMSDTPSWFLMANLYYEFQEGALPDCGMTPTLCDDRISVALISEAFSSEEKASARRDALLTGDLEGYDVRIVSLLPGQLPPYADAADAAALMSESILSVNGAKTTLPLFYADARFLCWLPDHSAALFAKPEGAGERLYLADTAGVKRLISETYFSTVAKACFSPDGTCLAFIEEAEEEHVITRMELSTGKAQVINREEISFGSNVSGITIDENGSHVYILGGDEFFSLFCYDAAADAVSVLAEEILVEGDLVYRNGFLLYCDVVDEYESVLRRSTETGEYDVLCHGSSFAVSRDGNLLAFITEDYEKAVSDLNVLDLTTDEIGTVLSDITSADYFISAEGNYVFYAMETGEEEFYYNIMRYTVADGTTQTMAQAVNAVFFPSQKDNELIISYNYSLEGETVPVTYIADFDAIYQQVQEET